jgi:uncharacterized membrane protein YdcZ (DUF606 family)
MKVTGIILLIAGLLLLIFTGIDFRTEETLLEVGNLELTGEEEHNVNWSPWLGAGIMVIGGILVFVGSRKT